WSWELSDFLETNRSNFVFFVSTASARTLSGPRLYTGPGHESGGHSRSPRDPSRADQPLGRRASQALLHTPGRRREAAVFHGCGGDLEILTGSTSDRRPVQDPV